MFRVSVRLFDSIVVRLVDGIANVCNMGRDCRQYFLVEHNGDVYPCDFFVQEGTLLGNIVEKSWDELLRSPVYESFGIRKGQTHAACRGCEHLWLCAADCLKHRGPEPGDAGRLSHLCEGWKQFYAHALPALRTIAARVSESRPRQDPAHSSVGRNDPCPCGSGRKRKNCCGA